MRKRTEKVLSYFEEVCKIPRPSGSEKEIRNYLKKWAEEKGYITEVDEVGNLIIECPSCQGFEDRPKLILQAHMDMVCISEEGFGYNPEADSIETYIEGDFLKAVGTSLGGDDGIGIALAQYLAADFVERGKLKLIFTVDEESTTIGAVKLAEKHLDAPYLINLDSEISDRVIISSAGCLELSGGCDNIEIPSSLDFGFIFKLQGLLGGHSGDDIGKQRLNAIVTTFKLLKSLAAEGILYEIEKFKGGTVSNSIPSTFFIRGNTNDYERFNGVIMAEFASLVKDYPEEKDACVFIEQTEKSGRVIGNHNFCGNCKQANDLSEFVLSIPNGVIEMSEKIEGLVTTSSNIGVINADLQSTSFHILIRSEKENKILQVCSSMEVLLKRLKIQFSKSELTPSWEADNDSALVKAMQKAYLEVTGEHLQTMALHGVLECAEFMRKKPTLDMISISPDVYDVHSHKERLYIPSVEKIAEAMECLLKNI